MTSFITRFYLLILGFALQMVSAQLIIRQENNPAGIRLSSGGHISTHLYASSNDQKFVSFASLPDPEMVVMVTRENYTEDAAKADYNRFVFSQFASPKFQILDENFQPVPALNTLQDFSQIKYIVKSKHQFTGAETAELETVYKIWNPGAGIKLGPITLHVYSLMFLLAFGLGYVLMTYIFKIDRVNLKYLEPLFTWTLLGTILGARLGHVIFYQPELFREDFLSVFLPIRTKPQLEFTGFSGLASHGATIMLIFTTLYYSFKIIRKNPLWVYDRLGIVVALGGAFVRIGNFFNSEIIGKIAPAGSPFAIFFPQMSDEYGVTVPRYPSQLFEAAGYFLLFVLLWLLYRYTNKKYQQGWLFGLFFVILWSIRFFVEFLKEKQGDEFIGFAGLNTGQVLSIPFMIAGVVLMLVSPKFRITEAENGKA